LNIDQKTVDGFGDEWERFPQSNLDPLEQNNLFNSYFSIFPWDKLSNDSEGFDLGCGSGRWAALVAPRVGRLHCVDPSDALEVAKKNLLKHSNCEFHKATVDTMPIKDSSMDFGYSLGVLHHIPNTEMGIVACVKKLKPGAPFLLYLYYDFENRPLWFRFIWSVSDIFRRIVSRLPHDLRYFASQIIALFVYYPIARLSKFIETLGGNVANFPLSSYRQLSFYTMRTDALDRFGTRLEQRFSRASIKSMMENSGLEHITFSNHEPYWCAIGYRELSVIGVD